MTYGGKFFLMQSLCIKTLLTHPIGSNWGNLGHPGGYSSYDYAAVIAENRMVDREKYSEAKLLANFVQASSAYITSTPGNLTNTTYTTSSDLSVTPLFGNGSATNFYVLR